MSILASRLPALKFLGIFGALNIGYSYFGKVDLMRQRRTSARAS